MNEQLTTLVVTIGIPFCLAAALMAFLITYTAYLRGQNPDKKLALRMALQTVFVALAVFAIIIVAIGFILARVIVE
jgi:membrane protein DedA with SNARE-associated domain